MIQREASDPGQHYICATLLCLIDVRLGHKHSGNACGGSALGTIQIQFSSVVDAEIYTCVLKLRTFLALTDCAGLVSHIDLQPLEHSWPSLLCLVN
jgi:hypothetical protein